MRLILLALLLLVAAPTRAAEPEVLADFDARFLQRADAEALKAQDAALRKALEAAPDDFELVWRMARLRQWEADCATDSRLKKVLGRQTWDLGDRAVKLAPERVEGHYYAALGVGAYAQAVGILKALGDGVESKFNERLDRALQLDPHFLGGAPLLTKGRYYFELPWPKRDLARSASFYEKALAKSPGNLRTWYFLAETLLKDGKARKAREAIEKVKQGSTAYDPAEGRRVQELAKKLDIEIGEELK